MNVCSLLFLSKQQQASHASGLVRGFANDSDFLRSLKESSETIQKQSNIYKEDIGNLAFLSLFCKDKEIKSKTTKMLKNVIHLIKRGKMVLQD